MDNIESDKQHILHNEKQRERYARKRKDVMHIEIQNQQKDVETTSNLGSQLASKQYIPSIVENEQ